jgi:hypothetical protein
MFLYYIGNSFWYFLFGGVLFGIGITFISGTREAILYETLVSLKKEHLFKHYFGKIMLYSHIVNAVFLIIVPFIYAIDPKLPFLLGMVIYSALFFVSLFFVEPPVKKESVKFLDTVGVALREINSNRFVLFLIVALAISLAFNYSMTEFIQPTFQLAGISVVFFGLIYAIKRIIMGVGSSLIGKLETKFNSRQIVIIASIILLISAVLFSTLFWVFVIIAFLALSLTEGMNRVVIEHSINKRIRPDTRTTILSIKSLSIDVFKIIIVIPLAIYTDLFGLGEMFKLVFVSFLIIFIAVLVIYKLIRN